jgi:hypothetical protein
MRKSKKITKGITLFIISIALVAIGFLLGKNYNVHNNGIPQGVILNSGPGLDKMQ